MQQDETLRLGYELRRDIDEVTLFYLKYGYNYLRATYLAFYETVGDSEIEIVDAK